MFHFLRKNNHVVAPISGVCIPIQDVTDELFSSKAMGEGFAIVPNDCQVVSPVDGNIVLIANTKHAIGLITKTGIEVLLHVGLDTVALNGKGFRVHKKQNEKVKAGEVLMDFDQTYLQDQSIDMTTMIVFTSGLTHDFILEHYGKQVKAGDLLLSEL